MYNVEYFWRGDFGDQYNKRNQRATLVDSNEVFFARALSSAKNIQSILELGCGTGQNLEALRRIYPVKPWSGAHNTRLCGIEINGDAAREAGHHGVVFYSSFLDEKLTPAAANLVFTKGVLIHVDPIDLGRVYERMHKWSTRYMLIAEYYSPKPVMISYRGHDNKLWKRDFAGEMMDMYPDLELIDYGFQYHRDPTAPQDDLNWFLLEKTRS